MPETMTYEAFTAAAGEEFDLDDPAQAVTLAAYVVGPNVKRIATFLRRSRSWCTEPARRLREQRIWRSGRIAVEGDDGPDGVELALQTAVAAGLLEVASDG